MNLIEEHLDTLRSGGPVRVAVPELEGDVVLLRAGLDETLEKVLEDALKDVREKKAWGQLARKARDSWAQDNPY
jgi:hypothetical protein